MNDHPATSHPTTHHISGAWADRLAGTVYVCVAAVALVGQSTAAVHWLGWPLLPSVAAVAILEVAAVAVAARADYRRRLGESAVVARLLATGIAAFMCVVNFVGHWMVGQTVAAWFFAMTTLVGYLIWLLHSAARRRDALREAGKLGVTSPEYGTWSWLVRPRVTARARWLALRDPGLGLHGSLDLAAEQLRREQRDRLLARQLRRRLRQHTDRTTARMAALTYDLDAIARGLADQANYGRLAALVGADLDPDRLLAAGPASSQVVDGQVVAEWAEREAEASTGQPSSGQPAEPATGQDTPVATGQPATGQPATSTATTPTATTWPTTRRSPRYNRPPGQPAANRPSPNWPTTCAPSTAPMGPTWSAPLPQRPPSAPGSAPARSAASGKPRTCTSSATPTLRNRNSLTYRRCPDVPPTAGRPGVDRRRAGR